MDLSSKLRHIHHFPIPGIDFIDITTVLKDPIYFKESIDRMVEIAKKYEYDIVVGSESRGFIMGAPVAYALGCGFVPIRKNGKLPAETVTVQYNLEYGKEQLQMHKDAFEPGTKVLVIDDLLATGGTAKANCELVEKLGGVVTANLFFIELMNLKGREKLEGYAVESICQIEENVL